MWSMSMYVLSGYLILSLFMVSLLFAVLLRRAHIQADKFEDEYAEAMMVWML